MNEAGILSILPPLVAFCLAVITRHVILSLGTGVLVGMTILNNFNPLKGFADLVELGLYAQLAKPANAKVIILIAIIGGFVNLLEHSGGMKAFARNMAKFVMSPVKAQFFLWIMGISIFFTDSGNSLILGPLFRPMFDRLRICREKLAFILDSTSSPVCVLIPVTSWGVFIMSLIGQSFAESSINETALEAWFASLPFQFYPIMALLAVPVFIASRKNFGPMARTQLKAGTADKSAYLSISDADAIKEEKSPAALVGAHAVWIPIVVVLLVLGSLFAYYFASEAELSGDKIQLSLAIAYLLGSAVCAFIVKTYGISLGTSFEIFLKGIGKLVLILIILLMAWSLGDVCKLLGTEQFIASLLKGNLPAYLLPASIFLAGAAISLSTGSSWGTFAILMPIAIPVSLEIQAPLYVTIAAVLSGGMFGDHTSPISDTTVLSSMASGCKHADHVNTQFPYAAVTGSFALVAFILAGLMPNGLLIIPACILMMVGLWIIMRIFGKNAFEETS